MHNSLTCPTKYVIRKPVLWSETEQRPPVLKSEASAEVSSNCILSTGHQATDQVWSYGSLGEDDPPSHLIYALWVHEFSLGSGLLQNRVLGHSVNYDPVCRP